MVCMFPSCAYETRDIFFFLMTCRFVRCSSSACRGIVLSDVLCFNAETAR